MREQLLSYLPWFVRAISKIQGVRTLANGTDTSAVALTLRLNRFAETLKLPDKAIQICALDAPIFLVFERLQLIFTNRLEKKVQRQAR